MLTVVTGPPCSGKTTYVAMHGLPGDIIIDFDDLAVALGAERYLWAEHDPIWHVILAARNAAITAAIERCQHGARAWIIDTVIPDWRKARYAAARARIIRLDASADGLHQRADKDGRPPHWHARIDDWFASGGKPATTARDPEPAARRTSW